ncbi:dynamin family protein [Rhodospirillum centenum]|uniref:Dynamin N-terminal domain-containing protein n=1 Tax=Rhodospirillum centenum (strain ATCC 51521 / SW) TaxID=414684 RepID=B6INA3_RHOCS|nr:dynamin family protein [Rhodospirillum centenum]ACI99000.1 conserved hypothetical protein [Rhodospirillum centenum SW]
MARTAADARIDSLRDHLRAENPDLVPLVETYSRMDAVLRRLRLIGPEETLTNRIGWWPVISAVGLYSAGKSTILNDFLGQPVQRTGNQAVDDKFTVICHGNELRELPGTALDVDPRFPFHQMGAEIEKVVPGEGKMVDRFLALKTVPAEEVKGLILVDSPGFDSDEYRASTLRLIDHILDLSDLALVVFDARKPEPGVMRDTLDKLVARVKDRPDATKFLFVLNQIDATAREDNLEEVVGAWQRALAGVGITGGRFYAIYSERAAGSAEVHPRLQEISRRDMAEIRLRIQQIPSVRGYRVASGLESVAKDVRDEAVPRLTDALRRWRRATGIATLAALVVGVAAVIAAAVGAGGIGLLAQEPWPYIAIAAVLLLVLAVRVVTARAAASRIARSLPAKLGAFGLSVREAFLEATRRPLIPRSTPVGWGPATDRRLREIHAEVSAEVRRLNDRYAVPSAPRGGSGPASGRGPLPPGQGEPPPRSVAVETPERTDVAARQATP